jgi:hypothetical protein
MSETQAVWTLILGAFALTVVWQRWGLWIVLGGLVAVLMGLWGWMLVGLLASPKVLLAVLALVWIGNRFRALTGARATGRSL